MSYTEQGWRNNTDTDRHHREKNWDYKGKGIYHVTLAVEKRYHLFGELTGTTPEEASIELTEMGRLVESTFNNLPSFLHQEDMM